MALQQQSLLKDGSADDLSSWFGRLHPRALLVGRDGSVAAIGSEFASALSGADPDALASAALHALTRGSNAGRTRAPLDFRDNRGGPLFASAIARALTHDFAATVRMSPVHDRQLDDSLAGELLGFVDAQVALLDADGFFLGASPALVRGLALACASELRGAPLAALIGSSGEADAAQKLLSGRDSERTALWLRCAGGQQRRALIRVQPLAGDRPAAHALCIEWEDRAPAPLEALAHDLRSPLSAVLGFARLAREDLASGAPARAASLIARIEQSASTIDEMLRGALTPMRGAETADVSQVLEQVRSERKRELERRGIRLLSPEDPPVLACRPSELYRLLSNLVGNAIDHMGEALAPEIAVSVACSGELATLRVRDNGVGIAPELHERIFELDHSAAARDERALHRGLGLAIVRELAVGWRGRAWVESARGAGAAFFVTIPVAR